MVNTKSDYRQEPYDACHSVLVELLQLLGEYRHMAVLVGGWVPAFLTKEKGREHVGTLDIDLALDFQQIPESSYAPILKLLTERGYERNADQPFRFMRTVRSPNGREIPVEVDFLSGEYGGTGKKHRTQRIQDLQARKARGCDLALHQWSIEQISGRMPDGSWNQVSLKVAGVVPFLVMKGFALADRMKEKDAYDAYFVVRHYPGGVEALLQEFAPLVENRLVRQGLEDLWEKFQRLDATGPIWVANFLELEGEDREFALRDAFERISRLLQTLGVP